MSNGIGSTRGNWTSQAGFILAATGSAIGLGNIWKFPYMAGEQGGGAFVLIYLGFVIIVGLPLMLAELMIGRRGQQNPVGAFQKLHREGSPWQMAGWLGVAAGFVILSFYSVVGGWAIAYIFESFAGFSGTDVEIQAQFTSLTGSAWKQVMWHTVFMALCVGIVVGGVQRGIERWSKILMPSLFAILVGLAIYGLVGTSGGSKALSFLFNPDFAGLSAEGTLSAMGHAFFTLSLGMGAMITYGSYMKREQSMIRDAVVISMLDTVIALVAGIAIFSLVFAYGYQPNQEEGLIFMTLPVLFAETGRWISIPFFFLLTFAAVTSGISLLEVVVSYFVDRRGWSRKVATISMALAIYTIGLLSAIPGLKFPFMDKSCFGVLAALSTNYMLPIGGLLTCLFVAWVMKDAARKDEFGSTGLLYKALVFTLKYISPIAVLIVLLHGLQLLPFMDYGN